MVDRQILDQIIKMAGSVCMCSFARIKTHKTESNVLMKDVQCAL